MTDAEKTQDPSAATQKLLEEILASKTFDKLDTFADTSRIETLSSKEKEILAEIFIAQADSFCREKKGQEAFIAMQSSLERAMKLCPHSARLWWKQGVLLARFDHDEALALASLSFEMATSIHSAYFEAFTAWADVLLKRALLLQDNDLMQLAEEKCAIAEPLLEKNHYSDDVRHSFYWRWGLVLFILYRHSGEAHELNCAIDCYKKADALQIKRDAFYNDMGNALVEFSTLIGRIELLMEAIDCYAQSFASIDPAHPPSQQELAIRYLNIGCCYQYLFEEQLQQLHFAQAKECFMKAYAADENLTQALVKLGSLLLLGAKLWADSFLHEESVHILEQAWKKTDSLTSLLLYIEALIYHARYTENINFLQQAKLCIDDALPKHPHLVDFHIVQGFALLEFARYFYDVGYCNQAITVLEKAKESEPTHAKLLYYLAQAHAYHGILENDKLSFEDALALYFLTSRTELGRYSYVWNEWGMTLIALSDLDKRTKYLEEASEKFGAAILLQDAVHPLWLLHYGAVLDILGDLLEDETYYERSIQVLSTCLSLDPASVDTHLQLGLAYLHLAEVTQDEESFLHALDHFEWLLTDDPEDEIAWHERGLVCIHLADNLTAYSQREKEEYYTKAEHSLMQAARLGNTHSYYTLACLYSIQQRVEEALFYFEKAVKISDLPPYRDILQDSWLEVISSTDHFQTLIRQLAHESDEVELSDDP